MKTSNAKLIGGLFGCALLGLIGCGAASDLLTVTLGAGDLAPIDINRGTTLGDIPDLTTCPEVSTRVSDGAGGTVEVEVSSVAEGCMIALIEPDRVLFDETQARETSDRLNGRDIDGLEEAFIEIERLELRDANGTRYPIETEASAVSLYLDGQEIVTETELAQVQTGSVRVRLSEATVQKLRDGIRNETAVTATIVLEMVFPLSALDGVPSYLEFDAYIQPIVTVDLIEAVI